MIAALNKIATQIEQGFIQAADELEKLRVKRLPKQLWYMEKLSERTPGVFRPMVFKFS